MTTGPKRDPKSGQGRRRCPICDLLTDLELCPEHATSTLLVDAPTPSVARLEVGAVIAGRDYLPAPDPPPPFEMGVLRPERRTLVERLIDMRGAPIFARANAEALIALVRSSRELRFEPGTTVWRRGDPSTYWFLVEYGRVRCTNAAGPVSASALTSRLSSR